MKTRRLLLMALAAAVAVPLLVSATVAGASSSQTNDPNRFDDPPITAIGDFDPDIAPWYVRQMKAGVPVTPRLSANSAASLDLSPNGVEDCGLFAAALWDYPDYVHGDGLLDCHGNGMAYINVYTELWRPRWYGRENLDTDVSEGYDVSQILSTSIYNCTGSGSHQYRVEAWAYVEDYSGKDLAIYTWDDTDITC